MNDILTEIETLKADFKAAGELLEQSQAQVETLNAAIAQFKEQAASKDSEASSLQELIKAQDSRIKELEAVVSQLQQANKTAEEKAVAIVASQGVAPMAVQATPARLTKADAMAEFARLQGKERGAYFAKHRALLIG